MSMFLYRSYSDDTVHDVCWGAESTNNGKHHFTMSENPA